MSSEYQSSSFLVEVPQARSSGANVLTRWWVAFAASTVCVLSGHLLIKAGLNASTHVASAPSLSERVLQILVQPQVITGLVIYLMGTVCWMAAVSKKEISFLYPLTSVNYVLVVACSTVLFHEIPTIRRLAGVATIVLGMVLMNRGPRSQAE
jgi:uncharacterized membrane protein